MAKKKDSSSSAEPEAENPMVDALKETLKKVEASLVPAVDSFCSGARKNDEDVLPSSLGVDFLHVKNTLLLSYLIDLVVHLRDTVEPLPSHSATSSDEENKEDESDSEDDRKQQLQQHVQQQKQQRRRLLEMRTVLDKSRGLDKKLRYQIEKLLSSLTDSSAFATGGEDSNDENDSGDEDDNDNGGQKGFTNAAEDDPLRYRPDLKAMMEGSEDDEDDSSDDDNSNSDEDSNDSVNEDEDEDDDLAAARATLSISKKNKSKKKNKENDSDEDDDGGATKKYVAPRLTAVPYTHDVASKREEKEKRQLRKLRASELAQTLRQQYGDQPDTEDVFGGGNAELYGKQRSASRALAQREAERTEFEESTMVRLTTSRKEKKEKKRIERMMEGAGNLAHISDLGNLVRETEAFGRSDNYHGSDDEYGERERAFEAYMSGEQNKNKNGDDGMSSRHASGKRRREPTTENRADGSGRRLKMGKQPKAYNSLQAALYGGGGGGGGSKKTKGKKKSKR